MIKGIMIESSLQIIIFFVAFIFSVIFHEVAHGRVADFFGDDTARISGRLSLNPLVHIDPIGSIVVPLILMVSNSGFLFGWAKPVPVNPFRLQGGIKAYRWVTLAGILTNFSLAIIAALVLKIAVPFIQASGNNLGVMFFVAVLQVNLVLAVFNALPFPGFDGFNFITTLPPVAELLRKTPLANPLFVANYGLVISLMLLFLLMPYVSQLFTFIFGIFLKFFGLL